MDFSSVYLATISDRGLSGTVKIVMANKPATDDKTSMPINVMKIRPIHFFSGFLCRAKLMPMPMLMSVLMSMLMRALMRVLMRYVLVPSY